MLKKILQWGLVAFVIFYVATQPASAAAAIKSVEGALQHTANGFSQFVSKSTT